MAEFVGTASRALKMVRVARVVRKAVGSDGDDRALAMRALTALLADARGTPMKIGQFLAGAWGDRALETLFDAVEPRPLEQMLPVLDGGLGRPASEVFASIEESNAAASLGQVHRGQLLDGTVVAVKLRYPGISEAVRAEMRLAGLIPGFGPVKTWGFDLRGYQSTLKQNMDHELDYVDEAHRQMRFAEAVEVPGLVVPKVYPQLCGPGVLVQSWHEGQKLKDASGWSQPEREAIAVILMRTFFASVFHGGLVHGDPHPGNLFFNRQLSGMPRVVLLDYGCTVDIDERARMALLKLIVGCHERDDTDPLRCLVAMGFDAGKLESIAGAVPALCQILFEPFRLDEPFSTKYWDMGKRIEALLGDLRWWFRAAGPARLLLVVRAFNGLIQQLETLKVMLPWWEVLVGVVGDPMIERARGAELPECSGVEVDRVRSFRGVAGHLKIRVTEGSRQVVALTMPASQTPFIMDHMPDDVLAKIKSQNIDLDRIVRDACTRGIVPGDLFSLWVDDRSYKVWLE